MKPTLAQLLAGCPGVEERLLREHLERIGDRYFEAFPVEQVCIHLRELASLSPSQPVRLLIEEGDGGRVDCTVLAFDYLAEFSLLSGTLAASGFNTLQGDVFTWARGEPVPTERRPAGLGAGTRPAPNDPLRRRRIIDRFSGTLRSPAGFPRWAEDLRRRLASLILLLESGREEDALLARQRVNEMVAAHLADMNLPPATALLPVFIDVGESEGDTTRIRVVSEDTPFFLYALSSALALRGITIERVSIRTVEGRIEDQFDILDAQGRPIGSGDLLDQVRLSVLLTKQFTYFLGQAPDPYTALVRFEQLVKDTLRQPRQGGWFELLSNPLVLQDLARLLGASDFLWEDFIRLQYESLLPMLAPQAGGRTYSEPPETLPQRLAAYVSEAADYEEKVRRLNEFKDRETFLLDLDHILTPGFDFRRLAQGLTLLAEAVVETAVGLARERLAGRYGVPRTIAGLPARLAVMGLGKLGGGDLGYASDIELLFVYSDSGRTSGAAESIENAEFYNLLVKESSRLIRTKREGIFQVDLRLRPFGASGPLACSLESFCRYFGPREEPAGGGGDAAPAGEAAGGRPAAGLSAPGAASALERLALVRLRTVAGDRGLGSRLERLRDEMIYVSRGIDLAELRALRERQLADKVGSSRGAVEGRTLNAKFSPGALVDLEYTVQILQVTFGDRHRAVRTPRIWEALDELGKAGVLRPEEEARISRAYRFFRRLINSLRMLRGSALDLFLPPAGSPEYAHLARRMGYARGEALASEQQLHVDFDTETAAIRAFVAQHLGRDSLPGEAAGNMADLVLSDDLAPDLVRRILGGYGFREPGRAAVNLRKLASGTGAPGAVSSSEPRAPSAAPGERGRDSFARLAVLAGDLLQQQPDPDMALNNWERFVRVLPDPDRHFQLMLSQPRGLEILLAIFSASQFLADTLIRNPEFLDWVTRAELLHRVRALEEMEADLAELSAGTPDHAQWLDGLRRLRRREILRIGTRDICLDAPPREIIRELSNLAEAVIRAALARRAAQAHGGGSSGVAPGETRGNSDGSAEGAATGFFVLAYGKLGGRELNYSSDLDLLGVSRDRPEKMGRLMEGLRADLSDHTAEGYAYRVDLRLRPFGQSGELVVSRSALLRYLAEQASPWELQAFLKARPVAGDLPPGEAFVAEARALLLRVPDRQAIFRSIDRMRAQTLRQLARRHGSGAPAPINVKSGAGGIRDVEFLVQGLQLAHARLAPEKLLGGNTLEALAALKNRGVLDPALADRLQEDYIFLRKVEHSLQLLEDRQVHALPRDPAELAALARRVLGVRSGAGEFLARLEETLRRVEAAYREAAGG